MMTYEMMNSIRDSLEQQLKEAEAAAADKASAAMLEEVLAVVDDMDFGILPAEDDYDCGLFDGWHKCVREFRSRLVALFSADTEVKP